MHYQYQVAGIAVGFRLPFRLTITEESQAFLRELGEPASGFHLYHSGIHLPQRIR